MLQLKSEKSTRLLFAPLSIIKYSVPVFPEFFSPIIYNIFLSYSLFKNEATTLS